MAPYSDIEKEECLKKPSLNQVLMSLSQGSQKEPLNQVSKMPPLQQDVFSGSRGSGEKKKQTNPNNIL